MADWRWAALLLALGCERDGDAPGSAAGADAGTDAGANSGRVLEAAENQDTTDAGAGEAPEAAKAEHVEIPAGSFVAGSTPGDEGREPVLEPALLRVELGPYDIDRFLYTDGDEPKVGVTRAQATELCAARGRRLCTELEWERACKGPAETAYAGRPRWDPACAAKADACASGFGVVGLGGRYREWTASDVEPVKDVQKGAAAVRGASHEAAGVDHRCAHRAAVDPEGSADDLAFRCCGGAPNAATIPSPKWVSTFRNVELPPDKAAELFREIDGLRRLTDPKYFDGEKAKDALLARSKLRDEPSGYRLTTAPLRWNPTPGEEILLITGQAGSDSFIVAFYILPDERYRIGSSLILEGEPGPVVFGYDTSVRNRLNWALCWECPGEWGRITYRKENRVVITQE